MSEIDQYDHRCLGIVSCPSHYEPFREWKRTIALYRFDSDATDDEDSFQAKRGDVILGGGGGECGALRIALPEAILFFTDIDWDGWETTDEIVQSYWSPAEAFIFCDGFVQVGWHPSFQEIDMWIAEHVTSFLIREYRSEFAQYIGSWPIDQDGSICRLPTEDERRILDWKHDR
jgi:hypothetical protein